jgi:tryptophan synthase beta chain
MKPLPDKKGHFGIFGGRYAAETLMPALIELEEAYSRARKDKFFMNWKKQDYFAQKEKQ